MPAKSRTGLELVSSSALSDGNSTINRVSDVPSLGSSDVSSPIARTSNDSDFDTGSLGEFRSSMLMFRSNEEVLPDLIAHKSVSIRGKGGRGRLYCEGAECLKEREELSVVFEAKG